MSTPLGSSQLFTSSSFYPHEIDQSLRFEDGDSPKLEITPTTTGNRKKWTFSCWFKRGNSSNGHFWNCNSQSGNDGIAAIYIQSDYIYSYYDTSGSNPSGAVGSTKIRDHSAWYHLVWAVDAANTEHKVYLNGTLISTDTSKYPPNYEYAMNRAGYVHTIGTESWGNSNYFDGYMAEIYHLDGQYLTADDFGETKSGIWIPKAYTGSYGTNGFYLDFADGSALGDDESGNANDFTASGLAATDVVLDSPTNNHSTFNVLEGESLITYSEGNLALSYSGNSARVLARSTIKIPANTDAFFEVKITSNLGSGVDMAIGIEDGTAKSANDSVVYANAYVIREGGNFIDQNTSGSYGDSFTNNDVIGVWRKANGDLLYYKNGNVMNSGTPAKTGLTGEFHFVAGPFNGASCIARFASDDWTNEPSDVTSQMSLCTASLPAPTIDPLLDQTPEDHFKAVLYTSDNIGSGGTQAVTGVGFQPDWCWIKNRTSNSTSHTSYTSVRGAGKMLKPNNTDTEDSNSQYGYLSSFDSDGFTLTGGSTNANYINQSTDNYVSWNWLAGGTASPNNDGDIESNVSVNTTAKFSVGTFTKGSGTQTVGHGLGVTPTMFFVKRHNGSGSWFTYHQDNTSAPETDYIRLNNTSGTTDDATVWGDTAPTSSVFTVAGAFNSGEELVFWAFAEVEGYSKMGTYEGNASNDGPFVYCGFRPAFLMVKTIDKAGGWHMYDNLRAFAGNEIDVRLEIDTAQENTSGPPHMDLLSNGFKLRSSFDNINPSSTMVFMAFAEQPFKYSNAR